MCTAVFWFASFFISVYGGGGVVESCIWKRKPSLSISCKAINLPNRPTAQTYHTLSHIETVKYLCTLWYYAVYKKNLTCTSRLAQAVYDLKCSCRFSNNLYLIVFCFYKVCDVFPQPNISRLELKLLWLNVFYYCY